MRTINKKLLKDLINAKKGLRNQVAAEAGCSLNLLEKMMSENYTSEPRDYYCRSIAKALNVDVDKLFPPIKNESGKS